MRLEVERFGVRFQNPVLLAAGTCGFGRELQDVLELESLGGFVTKSVTLEPRNGNPPPRVAEFGAGIVNSVGLANPGLRKVRDEELPWIRDHVRRARVIVSVAGHTLEEYCRIVEGLDSEEGFAAFELNLSCPNDDRLGGLPFALDPEATGRVVAGVKARTDRPLLVKLAPNVPDITEGVVAAQDAGADGITLVNTVPGLVLAGGAPALGAGAGGASGPALRPVGVHAVWRARQVAQVPLVGVGGILSADDAFQYLAAGASLVQVGTASFADPRAALRVIDGLRRIGRSRDIQSVDEAVGWAAVAP